MTVAAYVSHDPTPIPPSPSPPFSARNSRGKNMPPTLVHQFYSSIKIRYKYNTKIYIYITYK